MYKLIVLFLFFIFFYIPAFSQEILENTSFGIIINYKIPKGDFGDNWNNSFGLGGVATYEIDKNWSLEGNLGFNYFKSNKKNFENLPNILILSLPAGLKYKLPFASFFTFVSVGVQNNTFVFSGGSSDILDDNFVESEFGFFGSAGLWIKTNSQISIDLFWKYQEILSSPDVIPIHSLGFKIFFF